MGDSINNKWLFRVASSPEVGGGHVMRCLSIGRELHKYQSVHFLLCNGGEHWIDRIKYYSMTASIYKSPVEMKNTNVLIDGYGFSELEIQDWREQCKYMAFIDDNNTAPNYVDLVISSCMDNISQKNYKNQIVLHGNQYALLAPEYISSVSHNTEEVTNILVSCGLRDSNNFTSQVLGALSECDFKGNVNIAIGSQAPNLKKILNSVNNYNFPVNIVLDSNGLYDLLIQSDIVIGAGGVSLLERMALGKPSITIVAVENQRNQSVWSENSGATILVDPLEQQFQYDLTNAITILLKSEERRLEMSNKGMAIIDGKGGMRVARCMALGEC